MLRVLLSLLLLSLARVAVADTGPWQSDETGVLKARLISAVESVDDSDTLTAGLEFKLSEGWKVYWRSPGDAGLPPQLDFGGSAGIKSHALHFPAPKRFSILGLDSFGYEDEVILPLTLNLAPSDLSQDFTAIATLEGLVCKEVCIPVREVLTLALPKGGEAKPSRHGRRIAEWRARIPSMGTAFGVSITGVALAENILTIGLERSDHPLYGLDGDIIIETEKSGYSFSAPTFKRGVAEIEILGASAQELIGEEAIITVIGSGFMLEETARITEGRIANNTNTSTARLILLLAIAFLGGVILNVMPCVLPVLSLKLSRVVGMEGSAKHLVRKRFMVTGAGVIASFLMLGASLLALRQAGVSVGWGMQFQSPIFLASAAIAIGFFGLVMSDWITLPTPKIAAISTPSSGVVGDFMAGVLATLLATPCSAPFVGTAIAFALTAPSLELLLVFALMGLGLAMPWLLVAMHPQLIGLLPKPGRWIIWLKRILALGLFATALWLLAILASHYTTTATALKGNWQEWQPGLAERLAQEGRVVFVDVTADWCITCRTNKLLVLETDRIITAFTEEDVVLLRADWTLPDEAISNYLASHDRYGIPFNVVYSPRSQILLPEILTTARVISALNEATR